MFSYHTSTLGECSFIPDCVKNKYSPDYRLADFYMNVVQASSHNGGLVAMARTCGITPEALDGILEEIEKTKSPRSGRIRV